MQCFRAQLVAMAIEDLSIKEVSAIVRAREYQRPKRCQDAALVGCRPKLCRVQPMPNHAGSAELPLGLRLVRIADHVNVTQVVDQPRRSASIGCIRSAPV